MMTSTRRRIKPTNKSAVQFKESRGKRMLETLKITGKDKGILTELNVPKYESTKGLQPEEISELLKNKNSLENFGSFTSAMPNSDHYGNDCINSFVKSSITEEPKYDYMDSETTLTTTIEKVCFQNLDSCSGATNEHDRDDCSNTNIFGPEPRQDILSLFEDQIRIIDQADPSQGIAPTRIMQFVSGAGGGGEGSHEAVPDLTPHPIFNAHLCLLDLNDGEDTFWNNQLKLLDQTTFAENRLENMETSENRGTEKIPINFAAMRLIPYSDTDSSSEDDISTKNTHQSTLRSCEDENTNTKEIANVESHPCPPDYFKEPGCSCFCPVDPNKNASPLSYRHGDLGSSDTPKDPDYLPISSAEDTDDSDYEIEDLPTEINPKNKMSQQTSTRAPRRKNNRSLSSSDAHLQTPSSPNHFDSEEFDAPQTGGRRIRNKDFCFFCESWVTTFARHIVRNHKGELEVEEIMSHPVKSMERKHLLDVLRKRGNYLASNMGELRLVRKGNITDKALPCTFCLGLYRRKNLWRHRKNCSQNSGKAGGKVQGAAQALLTKDFKTSQDLREKVFNIMRADEISLAAQKDSLICAFGSRYLRTHQKTHQYNVCSRKMRELSRLLLSVKTIDPNIKNLIHALRPENFDTLVEAARAEAGFDDKTNTYTAPTYGMNIGTSLKDCCDIAIFHALKRKFCVEGKTAAELEGELRTTIHLIKSNWNVEVSHQASNCLSTNRMNKVTIVPLASDLKHFRDFLIEQGRTASEALQKNERDINAFKILTKNVYCRVILLCRKRAGELQRLPLDVYTSVENITNYEEFGGVVKPSEMILIKKFKRVVIHGKRKVTPVLFSPYIQEHIALLIKLRNNFVTPTNPFLFAAPGTENPIVGYKVLNDQAKKANLKMPQALTSRLLRKHLATISQLFHMSDQDIEQLASFMGHTSGIHRSEYRLPDDVFQTSKIAKVLLAMEKGQGSKYKGKSLDEIDLDDNLLNDENEESEDSLNEDNEEPLIQDFEEASSELPRSRAKSSLNKKVEKSKSKEKKRELIKWEQEEKTTVANFFKNHIRNKIPPKKKECELVMENNPGLFKNKTWLKIKVFVQNLYTNKTKV